jgi:hypothetical protein
MSHNATWATLAALGAFHGLNPAMGWLFAVARGLQERRQALVLGALPPIAVGHAVSVALILLGVTALSVWLGPAMLHLIGGVALLAFVGWKVATRLRHPRWVGMRVNGRELVGWSFLMSSAHGAGLMLLPLVLTLGTTPVRTVLAVSVHTVAMFAVMGAVAIGVYRWAGVGILRRAWVNVDVVWLTALTVAGVWTVASA